VGNHSMKSAMQKTRLRHLPETQNFCHFHNLGLPMQQPLDSVRSAIVECVYSIAAPSGDRGGTPCWAAGVIVKSGFAPPSVSMSARAI
jgi:hypothetical protein